MNLPTIGEELEIFIYQKHQMFIPSEKWLYGSDKKRIIMEPNTSYQYQYHVFQDEVITLDQPAQRCHVPDDSPSISTCIEEYMRKKFNCLLPLLGNHGDMETCSYNDTVDAMKFKDLLAVKAEFEIFKETGCMPSCDRRQIKLELISSRVENKKVPEIWFWFGYRDAVYNLNEEYLVFDYDLFTADIGGYLGLSLGFSFLSMYQILANCMTTKWIKRKRSYQNEQKSNII